MKLYEITSTHLAPKDRHTAIVKYLVATNDKDVFDYLSIGDGSEYTYWNDKIDIDEYMGDEYETAEEKMNSWISQTLDEQGEEWNDDLYTDLYYGRTIYGWRETGVTDEELMRLMIKNGIASFFSGEKIEL